MFLQEETTTDTYRANIVKKINSADALHHFENDGVVLNPLGTSPDNNNFQYALEPRVLTVALLRLTKHSFTIM